MEPSTTNTNTTMVSATSMWITSCPSHGSSRPRLLCGEEVDEEVDNEVDKGFDEVDEEVDDGGY